MQIGLIGLGRMGMNMARRLIQGGHEVVAYNRTAARTEEIAREGAVAAFSLEELVEKLDTPRVVWLMLPAGPPVDEHIAALRKLLDRGDILVDGGNTYYKDDIQRSRELADTGIKYVDAGVSGGIWGLEIGYCTMVGGPRDGFEALEPALETLAPEGGYLYCGPIGAGHFVKMVHNGIEYGMMQAYAEGFSLLEHSEYGKSLDYAEVSRMWNNGSVIRSWLLELAELAFRDSSRLEELAPYVEDSGEGRWTVQQAVDSAVSAPVITLSLMERFRSREENSFADRVLAALRNQFGGHAVRKKGQGGEHG
ncbi:MAG: phosphogluconate dehydrogenase (NAD(+)-dependent, decarboxylating) [Desulfovibrionales bacterium]